MSAMSDIDVMITEAGEKIEESAFRMRKILNQLREISAVDWSPLEAAFADLYDGGIDLVCELKGLYTDPVPTAGVMGPYIEAIESYAIPHKFIVGAPNPDDDVPEADKGAAASRFGIRVTHANGDEEDIPNIDGVLVHDRASNTFPFGFMPISSGDGDDEITEHRAVWFDEEGQRQTFDGRMAPKPHGTW